MERGRPAPRFALVRTSDGPLCRVRADIPDDLAEALIAVALAEPPMRRPDDPPTCDPEVTRLLSPIERTGGGPFYAFPAVIGPDVSVTEITPTTRHLVPSELGGPEDLPDHEFPCFAVVVDGRAVSVCRTARLVERAAQAGVNTIEAYRRKGYASRVVVAWGRTIRKMRREPIYSTWYENDASRALARSAGLTLVGVDHNVY